MLFRIFFIVTLALNLKTDILSWSKNPFVFSITSNGKIQTNYLATQHKVLSPHYSKIKYKSY